MPKSASDRLDTQITPKPALEKRSRRQFVPEYKLRIIAQADACKYGELGALLRREKLYSNQLSDWRREYAQNGVAGLRKSAPGPAPSKTPDQRRIEQLEKENSRLNRKLDIANDCLDLQKKALAMLDRLRSGKDVFYNASIKIKEDDKLTGIAQYSHSMSGETKANPWIFTYNPSIHLGRGQKILVAFVLIGGPL